MPKKNRKVRYGGFKRTTSLRQIISGANVVKIDKVGERYIVASPHIRREGVIGVAPSVKPAVNKRYGVLKFAVGDTKLEAEVEKLLKMNHRKGGITFVAPRVLSSADGGDDGVWPPFMPKDIKVRVKSVKIDSFKK